MPTHQHRRASGRLARRPSPEERRGETERYLPFVDDVEAPTLFAAGFRFAASCFFGAGFFGAGFFAAEGSFFVAEPFFTGSEALSLFFARATNLFARPEVAALQ